MLPLLLSPDPPYFRPVGKATAERPSLYMPRRENVTWPSFDVVGD
jgi:hypothetical protein